MSLKERTKTYVFTPFQYSMKVIVTNDVQSTYERLTRKLEGTLRPSTGCVAMTVQLPQQAIVLLPSKINLETIAHEITHAILFFMESIGAEMEHEFMAYYIGYYTAVVTKFVLNKQKTRRDNA